MMKKLLPTCLLLFTLNLLMAQYAAQDLAMNISDIENNFNFESSADIESKLTLASCPSEKGAGIATCAKGELLDFMYQMQYPSSAYQYQIEGECRVNFTVSDKGEISDLVVSNCSEIMFKPAISDRLSKLEWQPATKNGRNVESTTQFDISFEL